MVSELSFVDVEGLIKSAGEFSKSLSNKPEDEKVNSGAPIIEDWVSDSEDELDESTTRSTQSSDVSKSDARLKQCAKKEEIPQVVKPKINQDKFLKPALGCALSKRVVIY